MAAIDDVSLAIQAAVISIINTVPPGQSVPGAFVDDGQGPVYIANPKLQVIVGFPFGTSLTEILGQKQAQISVFPLSEASRTVTNRKPVWKNMTTPNVPLSVALSASGKTWTATFSGSVIAGLNIHALCGIPSQSAYYGTSGSDTPSTVAAAVATQITALAMQGVNASASGNVLTVTNLNRLIIGIGGSNTMAQEVARVLTPYQISVWAATADLRTALSKQIEGSLCVGLQDNFLYAADGSAIRVRKRGSPRFNDNSQRSYSLYISHIQYECIYPVLQQTTGTQVEEIDTTLEMQDAQGNVAQTETFIAP